MCSELHKLINYSSGVPYINSNYIIEYDLSKANITSLLYYKEIDETLYNTLYNMDKIKREVYIGNLIRTNKNIYKAIKNGISYAKKLFFENNDIKDNEVLSIRNDAIFIIGNREMKTDFSPFIFSKKNTYTFFMKTSTRLELYYRYDRLTDMEYFDVKGINDSVLPKNEVFITLLCDTFFNIQNKTIEEAIQIFQNVYNNFIARKMDIEYYRSFDADSSFYIMSRDFALDVITIKDINNIDITINLQILRDIHSILSDMYFSTKKR